MISDLVRYIEDARRQGFAVEEIKRHVSSHGWNEYLIDYAVAQVERRSDRIWLQGSMMAIFVIVLASAGAVWWVNTGGSTASCLLESSQGSWMVVSDASACCRRIPKAACSPAGAGIDVRDQAGKVVFSPEIVCKSGDQAMLTTQKMLEQCQAWLSS